MSFARAIESLKDEDPALVVRALRDIFSAISTEATKLEAEPAELVAKLALHASHEVRREIPGVLVFAEASSVDRFSIFLRLLRDESPLVREEAAAALGDLGDARARPYLIERLEDDHEPTSFESAYALSILGHAAGVSVLLKHLAGPKKFDVCYALRKLGEKANEAIPNLQFLAKKWLLPWPDKLVVLATLYAVGDQSALDPLKARLKSWNKQERILARGLLSELAESADAHLAHAPRAILAEFGSSP